MSINNADSISVFQSLQNIYKPQEQIAEKPESNFSNHLDSALENPFLYPGNSTETMHQAAELFKLSSTRKSLELLTDDPNTDNTANMPLASALNATIPVKTYLENLAEAAKTQPILHNTQPLPKIEQEQMLPENIESQSSQSSDIFISANMEQTIAKAARRYGVDAGLIKAVIKAESNFNHKAVSSAGAQGLMQLMPATARGLGVSDPFDPEQNIMGGTRYLRSLLDRYDGDIDSALAAYNWGPGNIDRRPERLPAETRNYLLKVKQYYSA